MNPWPQGYWRESLWLWLALYPLLIGLWVGLQGVWRQSSWLDPALLPWMRYRPARQTWRWLFNRSGLWAVAWLLLSIALAGPRLPLQVAGSAQPSLPQVMVVLDLSRSMSATDLAPSRLARSTLTLQALLRQGRDSRYGMVVYGLQPHLLFPLTADRWAASHYLRSVEPGLLPGEGSLVVPALGLAREELQSTATPAAGQVILWISDGEVSDYTALDAELQRQQQSGIRLIIYALGTLQGAGLQTDQGAWLEHQGQAVVTALPRAKLQALARRYGALYLEATNTEADWRTIYQQGILPLARPVAPLSAGEQQQWRELYPPFLYAGVALLLLSLLAYRPGKAIGSAVMLLLCAGLWLGAPLPSAYAADATDWRAAYSAYAEGDYELAWQRYAALPGYPARMAQAQAAYQQSLYGGARQQAVQAFLLAGDDGQRAKALFILANSAYKMGDYTAAVEGYQDLLRYQATHTGARVNLDYARALQAELALFREAEAGRKGRGPQTRDAETDEDLSERGLTLGQQTEPLALSWSGDERQALLQRGLEFAQLASQAQNPQSGEALQYQIGDLSSLQRARILPRREHKLFWQRLFASEEGLAAPPQQPLTEEGVAPW